MGDSFDALGQAVLMQTCHKKNLLTDSSNIHLSISNTLPQIEQEYFRKMLTLYGKLPQLFTGLDNYSFFAEINDKRQTTMGYRFDGHKTDEFLSGFILLWQDALTEAVKAPENRLNGAYNDSSEVYKLYGAETLVDILEFAAQDLMDVNQGLTKAVYQAGLSIHAELIKTEANDFDETASPKHLAISTALKTIISSFDKTDDFEVIPFNHDNGEDIIPVCKITLGQNTPVSYEHRFQTLREVYDLFDAVSGEPCQGFYVQHSACETEVALIIEDPLKTAITLTSLYDDLQIFSKAIEDKARMMIHPSELIAICADDNHKAAKYQPYQH